MGWRSFAWTVNEWWEVDPTAVESRNCYSVLGRCLSTLLALLGSPENSPITGEDGCKDGHRPAMQSSRHWEAAGRSRVGVLSPCRTENKAQVVW